MHWNVSLMITQMFILLFKYLFMNINIYKHICIKHLIRLSFKAGILNILYLVYFTKIIKLFIIVHMNWRFYSN